MSPKSKEQFAQIRQRSRDTILQTALELFAHYGYHNTSMQKIAKAAGISKGLIYNYFDNKEGLLHQIVNKAMDEGDQLMNQTLDDPANKPKQRLEALIHAAVDAVKKDLHYYKLLAALSFQAEVLDNFKEELHQKNQEALARLANVLQEMECPQPLKEAMALAALLDGIVLHYIHIGADYPIEEMKTFIIQKYNIQY